MRPPLGHVHVYVRSTRTCTASAATAAAAGHNCRTLATRRGTATSVQDTLANPARTFCRRGSFEPACVTMASAGGRGGGRGSSGGGGGGGGFGRASADERDPLPLGTAYDSRTNCSDALKHADDVWGGKGVRRGSSRSRGDYAEFRCPSVILSVSENGKNKGKTVWVGESLE